MNSIYHTCLFFVLAARGFIVMTNNLADEPANPSRPHTVTDLLKTPAFLALLPAVDPFVENHMLDSCAVVGNSASILDSGRGAEIDAHDAVFRINFPPMNGFEGDVGTKTTVLFANERWGGHHLGRPEVIGIGDYGALDVVLELNILPSFDVFMHLHERAGTEKVNAFVLSGNVGQSTYRFLNEISTVDGVVPSTGLYAVFAALLRCRRVSLFAFGDPRNSMLNHYWSPPQSNPAAYDKHAFAIEEFLFLAMEQGVMLLPKEMHDILTHKPLVKYHHTEAHRRYCYGDFVQTGFVSMLHSEELDKIFHAECDKEETTRPPTSRSLTSRSPTSRPALASRPTLASRPAVSRATAPPQPPRTTTTTHKRLELVPHTTSRPPFSIKVQNVNVIVGTYASRPPEGGYTTLGSEPYEEPRIMDLLAKCDKVQQKERLSDCDVLATECLNTDMQTVRTVCSCFDAWTYCHIRARCGFDIKEACSRIGCRPIPCVHVKDPNRVVDVLTGVGGDAPLDVDESEHAMDRMLTASMQREIVYVGVLVVILVPAYAIGRWRASALFDVAGRGSIAARALKAAGFKDA